MPTLLPSATRAAIERSLARYTGELGGDAIKRSVEKMLTGVESVLNPVQEERVLEDGRKTTVTVGQTPADVRAGITRLVDRFGPETIAEEMNLDFKIDVATSVARGAGRHVADNYDQAELDEIPALELLRVYDRDTPRGFKLEKGALVTVPGDDWPSRWRAAAQTVGDTDALRILGDTGRMIALKASPIWQALGDGAGGYDDTLGNPYPPFAFNSGYDTDGVDRAQCEELGLIRPGQRAPRAEIDFNQLFAPVEVAA